MADSNLSTVARALAVLGAFSYDEPVLGVSELSRRLGLGKSSVHRMLQTLLEAGFVAKTGDDRYRLGLRLYELGQLAVASLRLREVAHPFLERLRNETGETAHLAVLEGTDVVYLDRFESPRTLRLFSRVGHRGPAYSTSSGKVLLAFGAPETVEAVIANGLRRSAPRTITQRSTLLRALDEVRRQGYAVSVEEREPGVTSVGAPVFGHDGSCIAAVSIAGPVMRMTPEQLPKLVRLVRRCAADISTSMGWRPAAETLGLGRVGSGRRSG